MPEIVIVGGGALGASLAWHLASRGCRDVLLLDRGAAPGAGSTGRATGGFRAQFATEINIRLSLLGREKLLRFLEEVGADPCYRPVGYLMLAGSERQLATQRSLLPLQHSCGVPVRAVTPEEAREINPAADLTGIPGGTFCAIDGTIRPLHILNGYLEAARRLGVRCSFGADVVGLERQGDRVTGVRTADGVIAAGAVVNAAGAWAAPLARTAGLDLPVEPARRQVAITEPFAGLPEEMPMTVFLEDSFHLRVRDGRVLLLWPDAEPRDDPFDVSFDPRWLAGLLARAHAHIPCLRQARVVPGECWAGLYEMSPDHHALVGPAPGLSGFYLLNGCSGHGVMHAPALGQLLAEQILDGRAHTLDLHPLRPERFQEGEPNPEISLL